jgi:hypothetical protein
LGDEIAFGENRILTRVTMSTDVKEDAAGVDEKNSSAANSRSRHFAARKSGVPANRQPGPASRHGVTGSAPSRVEARAAASTTPTALADHNDRTAIRALGFTVDTENHGVFCSVARLGAGRSLRGDLLLFLDDRQQLGT